MTAKVVGDFPLRSSDTFELANVIIRLSIVAGPNETMGLCADAINILDNDNPDELFTPEPSKFLIKQVTCMFRR